MLKSSGEAKIRPGRNDVSRYWLARSTTPLNSGSRAGASFRLAPIEPVNAAAAVDGLPVPPIAASRSHTRVRGHRPRPWISCHMPEVRSPA